MKLLGAHRPELAAAVGRVVELAVAAGAPPADWIVIEDMDETWRRELLGLANAARRRTVMVAATEIGASVAARLGVGGATWQPPSTEAMRAALVASASATERGPTVDRRVAAAVADDAATLLAVGFANASVWRLQRGRDRLASVLGALATAAGTPLALVEGPVLLMAGADPDQVARLWFEVRERHPWSLGLGLAVGPIGRALHSGELVEAANRAVQEPSAAIAPSGHGVPVFELPSGRLAGRWSACERSGDAEGGWHATPAGAAGHGLCWRLVHPDGSESATVDRAHGFVAAVAAGPVLRLAPWAVRSLAAGSPGALLAHLAQDAARALGVPVWAPEVDRLGLRLLQSVPGSWWVDGPATPRQ